MATKVPKERYDVSTTAGAIAADKEQRRLYEFMLSKSAADRFKYLTNSGWKQTGKEKIIDEATGKEFVRVSWEAPAEYEEKKPFNQTRALLYEIWLDLERNGVVYRSDAPGYVAPFIADAGQDNVVALVTA